MTNDVETRELGPEAWEYFWSALQKGGPLLSSASLAGGVIHSLPPIDKPVTRIEYDEGGIFSPEQAFEARQHICRLFMEYLRLDPSHLILFEDQFFSMNDPAIVGDEHVFDYRGVTYHYRSQALGGSTSDEIDNAISTASHYPLIIILTKLSPLEGLSPRAALTEGMAQNLVHNVQRIFVGAYDEEGFLEWSRETF